MIEKVMLNTTLKAGQDVWEEGRILNSPLPQAILDEIACDTGTIKIIAGDGRPSSKIVFVAERVAETATSMTTMAVSKPVVKERPKIIQSTPKVKVNKLIRR